VLTRADAKKDRAPTSIPSSEGQVDIGLRYTGVAVSWSVESTRRSKPGYQQWKTEARGAASRPRNRTCRSIASVIECLEEWKWMGTPVWSHNGSLHRRDIQERREDEFSKGASPEGPPRLFNSSLDGTRDEPSTSTRARRSTRLP